MTATTHMLAPRQVLDLTVRDLYRYAHSIGRNPLDVLREALAHL